MDLEKQLDLIFKWFQGTFDSHMQYQFEKELQEKDGTEPLHNWVFYIFRAVDAPNFGTHVLVAEQGFRTTGQFYRKRIYSFHTNAEAGCVECDFYKLKDESLFERLEQEPSLLAGLDPSMDAEKMEGCSLLWEYLSDEHRFHGRTREGTCRFPSTTIPGKTIIGSSDAFIGSDHLWTRDRAVDLDGNKIYGFTSDEHHKFLHCRTYKGTIRFGHEQEQEVIIHNQGQKFRIGDTEYFLKLAQSTELETKATPTALKLSVHQSGEEEVIGIAISDSDSSVIGGHFATGIEVYLARQDM